MITYLFYKLDQKSFRTSKYSDNSKFQLFRIKTVLFDFDLLITLFFFFKAPEFIPSTWKGNYTCSTDSQEVTFILNITKSGDTIGTLGDLQIQGHSIPVSGTFGSFLKSLTLQNNGVVMDKIAGRNFTKVELNGILKSPLLIEGGMIFISNATFDTCPVQLRRVACKCERYFLSKRE